MYFLHFHWNCIIHNARVHIPLHFWDIDRVCDYLNTNFPIRVFWKKKTCTIIIIFLCKWVKKNIIFTAAFQIRYYLSCWDRNIWSSYHRIDQIRDTGLIHRGTKWLNMQLWCQCSVPSRMWRYIFQYDKKELKCGTIPEGQATCRLVGKNIFFFASSVIIPAVESNRVVQKCFGMLNHWIILYFIL